MARKRIKKRVRTRKHDKTVIKPSWDDVKAAGPTGVFAAVLLAVSLLAGGGGAEAFFIKGLLAVAGGTLMVMAIAAHFTGQRRIPFSGLFIVLLLFAALGLGIFQLLSIADAPWTNVGLRTLDYDVLAAIGLADEARSLTLDPEGTKRALMAFLLPTGLILAGLGASFREVRAWLWIVFGAGLIHAIVGILQLILAGPDWLQFFAARTSAASAGFFANSNHFSTAMLLATLAASALVLSAPYRVDIRNTPRLVDHLPWLGMVFFAMAAIGSGSRAGAMLGLFAVPAALILALPWRNVVRSLGALLILPLLAVAYLAAYPSGYQAAFRQDLTSTEDLRFSLLPDLFYLLDGYWAWGSGLGTFVPIFAAQENLDNVIVAYVNHAHNDWLEWLIETGLPGAILLGLLIVLLAYLAIRTLLATRKKDTPDLKLMLIGGAMVVTVAVHSAFDYPIRMAAIAAVMALAVVLIAGEWRRESPAPAEEPAGKVKRWLPVGLALGASAILAMAVLPMALAQQHFRDGNFERALSLRPAHPQAAARVAAALAREDEWQSAEQLAVRAIREAPINQMAFRVLASSLQQRDEEAAPAWLAAMKLGWRDSQVQLYAFQSAVRTEEFGIAALRADAYMRTQANSGSFPEFLAAARIAGNHEQFRAAFVERLALSPPWRRQIFAVGEEIREGELEGLTQIVLAAEESDLPISPIEGSPFIRALVNAGQHRVAHRLDVALRFRGQSPQATLTTDFDEDFAGQALSPFQWVTHNSDSVFTSLEGTGDRHVFVESRGSENYPAISRLAVLPAGQWEMTYREWSTSSTTSPVRPVVTCVGGSVLSTGDFATISRRPSDYSFRFQVPANCEAVGIQLAASLTGEDRTSSIDDIRLRQIAR